jgi:thiopeptide-type bacteriocin biosynthesis protein
LLRTTALPFGTRAWTDYHVAFRERYGPAALVPMRDLVADSGLGFPAGFLDAAQGTAPRPATDRDAALLALIQQAASNGADELELTDQVISALAVASPDQMIVPDRVELAFEVHARTASDIDRGQFLLWVTGAPRPSSSMAGRFAGLLPSQARALLAASYDPPAHAAAGTAVTERPLTAQLSFTPRRLHNDNVVRVPPLLPAQIALGQYPATGTTCRPVSLDELAVTASATQMFLIHTPTGRQVTPRVLHALEASVQTPPLARFLAEISSARHAVYGPFDFGAARVLPYLPRVRYRRTVLAPARWTLPAEDLPAPNHPHAAWDDALRAWRERWRAPARMTLIQGELRLPVDLDCQAHRAILRARLGRAGSLELREGPDPASRTWTGRPCEFLLPLTAATAPAVTVPRTDRPARPAPWAPPGRGDLIHALLLGHPARYGDILTDHLPSLLGTLGAHVLRWWFRRYRDTTSPGNREHLSLYLRLSSADLHSTVTARLAGFANDLHQNGLLADLAFAACQPQTGRYGPDMRAAEQVAAADSAAALVQITTATRSRIPLQVLTAASMTAIATGLAPDTQTGYRWLADLLPRTAARPDRALRDAAVDLAAAATGALRQRPGGAAVADAWQTRHLALSAYRAKLAPTREPATVLRSLLHDHHARAMGIGPDTEDVTNTLARAAALRGLARAQNSR